MKIIRLKEIALVSLIVLAASSIALAYLSNGQRADEYYKQGYIYYQARNYNAAIAEYDKALILAPNMAKAHYWKAKCYLMLKDYDNAAESVASSLNSDPNISDGRSLRDKIERTSVKKVEAPATPTPPMIEPTKPDEPTGPARISMDLRAVEISHAFRLLAKETGGNITVGSDVHGKISLTLNSVTTGEAFDAILKASNCTYVIEGNVIRILPTGEPQRMQMLPGGIINKTFTIDYVDPNDLAVTLGNLLPEGTKVITTKGSNYIIVEGLEDAVEKAESIIANIDTPPEQVMVEAKIVELSNSVTSALGVNLKYTNPDNPNEVAQTKGLASQPTATTATGLYYTVTNQDLETLLEALQVKTGYNLLSSPKVLAINGKEAEIITGQRLGYKIKTITTTGLIESVEFLDVGTKLVFTPMIKSSGYILMDIHPEISEGSIVNDLPQKKSTETTTQLLVKDGDTIVIGGLMKDTTQKVNKGVPFLSEIPILGVPFRRVELTTEQREIVILIAPHIMKDSQRLQYNVEAEKLETRTKEQHYGSPIDLVK